uniref:Uncharacterized protein n=1 Tax=Spironucleus salmonicida TaxID=348837 RepID=V6LWW2_9EUKA|eukprot:EST48186.1 Hypothetical protein SS50377_11669 [Spironucleus salmonicida]
MPSLHAPSAYYTIFPRSKNDLRDLPARGRLPAAAVPEDAAPDHGLLQAAHAEAGDVLLLAVPRRPEPARAAGARPVCGLLRVLRPERGQPGGGAPLLLEPLFRGTARGGHPPGAHEVPGHAATGADSAAPHGHSGLHGARHPAGGGRDALRPERLPRLRWRAHHLPQRPQRDRPARLPAELIVRPGLPGVFCGPAHHRAHAPALHAGSPHQQAQDGDGRVRVQPQHCAGPGQLRGRPGWAAALVRPG